MDDREGELEVACFVLAQFHLFTFSVVVAAAAIDMDLIRKACLQSLMGYGTIEKKEFEEVFGKIWQSE